MKRLQKWATKHIRAIRIGLVVAMLGLALWGLVLGYSFASGHYVIANTGSGRFLGYFLVNLGPELAGIVIGVVIIDALNDWRQTEQLKAQLIRQMGSPIKDVAVPAVMELRYHRWLIDGSLRKGFFGGANLIEADLSGAFLEGAYLAHAHLEGARLLRAHLEEAKLLETNLEGAEGLTHQQLKSATSVAGSTMPDGTILKDPENLSSYPDSPTLEEWLATRPNCLDWSDEEEIDPSAVDEMTASLDDSIPEDDQE